MKRNINSRSQSQGRRGVASSAALLASLIMAGSAAAQNYSADAVIGNPTKWQDATVTVSNGAHLTPGPGGGSLEAGNGYILRDGFIDRVSLRNGERWVIDPVNGDHYAYFSADVLKNSDGVVTLLGEHYYTGSTSINQGTLVLGDGVNTATLMSTSGVTIGINGRLRLDFGNNSFTHNGTSILNNGVFEVLNGAGQITTISGVTMFAGAAVAGSEYIVNGGGTTVLRSSTLISSDSHTIASGTERVETTASLFANNIKVGESDAATLDVNGGTVANQNGTGTSQISLAVDGSQLLVRNGGVVHGHVNGVAAGTNNITVEGAGSLLDGAVSLDDGTVKVSFGGGISSNVTLDTGALILNNGSVFGDTTITEGYISATNGSYLADAHITEGGISLSGGSEGGTLTVVKGDVSLNSGSLADEIKALDGNVVLNDASEANAIKVGIGNVLVNDNSGGGDISLITGEGAHSGYSVAVNDNSTASSITVTTGSVLVDNESSTGAVSVTTGDVRIDRGSNALDGISLSSGLISIDNGSFATGVIKNSDGNIAVHGDSTLDDATVIVEEGTISIYDSTVLSTTSRSSLEADKGVIGIGGASSVDADIYVTRGTGTNNLAVDITGGSTVTGDIGVEFGLAQIHGINTTVTGDVGIDQGDLLVADHAALNGDALIHDGGVYLHNGASITGDLVGILHIGAVSITGNSNITADVYVNQNIDGQAAVQVSDYSSLQGSVEVGIGNVVVDDHSSIEDWTGYLAITDEGSLFVDNHSGIETGDVFLAKGDMTVLGQSYVDVNNVIELQRGTLFVSEESDIWADDIYLGLGDVIAYDDSFISASFDIVIDSGGLGANNSRIRAGDDIRLLNGSLGAYNRGRIRAGDDIVLNSGNLESIDNSRIRADDDIILREGNLVALNNSRVRAGDDIRLMKGGIYAVDSRVRAGDRISLRDGDIELDNSFLRSNSLYSHEGDILVTNNSTIRSRTTINDGLLYIDETSRHIGRVNVNGDAAAWVEGTVYGTVNLRHGTDNVDGGVLIGENVTITRNLINDGVIAPGIPGGSVGKINVGDDFYQEAGGTYLVDIHNRKDFDQILVGGSATIDGGSIYIDRHGHKPYRRDSWSVIEAAGGVNVLDGYTVHHNFAKNTMLKAEVHYHDRSVEVYIKQLKFEPRGKTPNQRAVGRALDYAAKRDQLDPLFDHLNYTDRGNVPRLLRLLSPETLTTIFNVGFANAQIQNVNIERRLDDVRAGSRGFSSNGLALSNNRGTINFDGAPVINDRDGLSLAGFDGKAIVRKDVVAPIIEESPWGFFVTGSGEWADIETSYEAKGADFTSGGVTVGADYRVSDNFVVGLFGGYVHTTADLMLGGDIKANGGRLGLYGSYFNDGFYVNALASGGYNHYKINRNTVGGMARGKTDGGQFDGLIGAGYDFSLGCVTLGPVGSVQYSYVGFDKFNEHGSDARLNVAKNNQDSLRTLLGAKVGTSWNIGGMVLRPEVRAQWKHEYLDREGAIDSSFTGSGALFTVHGPTIGRNSVVVDAGASLDVSDTLSIYAYYTGELARDNYSSNSVNGGFRLSF